MSHTSITVKRNWKKKRQALCVGIHSVSVYSLNNNFSGVEVNVEDMESFLEKEDDNFRGSRLTYVKETGACCIHVHSNLWYSWVNKIDW